MTIYKYKGKFANAANSFIWGFFMTGMPIWYFEINIKLLTLTRAFFMFKYSFYSMTIRKFEKEQFEQTEEALILRDYYKKKLDIKGDVDDEQLVNKLTKKRQEVFNLHNQLAEFENEELE